ncbi:kinase-like domain-containing protein [Clohesyomyces aquaticus]|uniref:EKC/KEOPS complex subunit BUD32 n=1 Tax=Clohesyomyces aquaticus TaxID=1231657 RepID=A0A1Y1ZW57_9PLEO|nr:kinase-like domain-containing protein [Clohesyomyces aquaticus]
MNVGLEVACGQQTNSPEKDVPELIDKPSKIARHHHIFPTYTLEFPTLPAIMPEIASPPSPIAVPPQSSSPLHILPPPFTDSNLTVLTQGAEALVYLTTFLTPSTPVVLKYRPPKPYRHPILDKRLTKARLLAEARVLVKCRKEGVKVPGVIGGDYENGWLVLEYIDGVTTRKCLDEWVHRVGMKVVQQDRERGNAERKLEAAAENGVQGEEQELWDLMRRVGSAVGKLHEIGVCHGDLTTSNLMVRKKARSRTEEPHPWPAGRQTASAIREAAITDVDAAPSPAEPMESELSGDIVIIDFGLATQTIADEDRAVDLYVLERAFAATHPAAEPLFREVLKVYGDSFKGAKVVLRRLEDVRLRGRKRSMLG